MAQADPDPPSKAELLVRRAVNRVLERRIAGPPGQGTRPSDVLAEFLAEIGLLALADLAGPVPPAAVRPELGGLDERRFALLAKLVPARRVSSHALAAGAGLRHPELGFNPANN
jgi:hypothetical protein